MAIDENYLYILDSYGVHSIDLESNQTALLSREASAVSIEIYEDELFVLRENGLYRGNQQIINGSFISFSIYNESIYLANRQSVVVYNLNGQQIRPLSRAIPQIRQISVSNKGAFALVDLPQGLFAIYRIDTVDPVRVIMDSPSSPPVSIFALDDALLVLTAGTLYKYFLQGGIMRSPWSISLDITHHRQTAVTMTASNDYVFFSNLIDNVYQTNHNIADTQSRPSLFVAAGSNADFFFNSPRAVSYRFDNIIVSDTLNHRVSLLNENSPMQFEHEIMRYPVSAVMTSSQDLVVAHSRNMLFNVETEHNMSILLNGYMINIEKLVVCQDYVYVLFEELSINRRRFVERLDSNGLYSSGIFEQLSNPLSIGNKIGGGVFVYDDGAIRSLDDDNLIINSEVSLIDFFVDYENNVFGINNDGHFVAIVNSEISVFESLGVFSNISFAKSNGSGLAYSNDILLVNNSTHSLFRLSNDLVFDISTAYTAPPPSASLNIARPQTQNAIAATKINTALLSGPVEAQKNAIIHLPAGTQVLIRREIPSPPNMYFIAAFLNDAANHPIIACGFVYRAAINAPAAYAPPQNTSGQIILPNTHIFVFPSTASRTYTTLRQGEMVKILDFVTDRIANSLWLRIATSENREGFVLADRINTGFVLNIANANNPSNASLRAEAMLLIYLHGTGLTPLKTLPMGTRIQIETPFDSARRYTRVIVYVDGERVDVFVQTQYVDFDGWDIWLVVLIIVVPTIAIALIVLAIVMKKRRHRVMPYGRYMEDE